MIPAAHPDHVNCGFFFCHPVLDNSAAVDSVDLSQAARVYESPHVVFPPEPPDWIGSDWHAGKQEWVRNNIGEIAFYRVCYHLSDHHQATASRPLHCYLHH